jgi:hypothetical protein
LSDVSEQKIKISAGLTPRVVALIDGESKRNGISFADQLRRITDAWADTFTRAHERPADRVVVLDRASGQLLRTT